MKDMIENTRLKYTEKRKSFGFFDKQYNKLTPPAWMKQVKDTRFQSQYRDQEMLLSRGEVVFAHLIQANSLLFQPGDSDAPAAIVFSSDHYYDDHVDELLIIGHAMFDLKGKTQDDPELKRFAKAITDEVSALFNVKLPEKLTNGRKVYYSTIIIHRKHLPVKYLKTRWFPVLIHPETTEACMILPSKYWAPNLVEYWSLDS